MPNLKAFDLTKGSLPLVVALGLIMTVATLSIQVGRTIAHYEQSQSEMIALAKEVAALQQVILTLRPEDRWQRSDQVLFCWEAERINSNWRCPAITPASQIGDVPRELRR
jgi:hypothetical protein